MKKHRVARVHEGNAKPAEYTQYVRMLIFFSLLQFFSASVLATIMVDCLLKQVTITGHSKRTAISVWHSLLDNHIWLVCSNL